MNIKQAKQIPIENIVQQLGGKAAHVKGNDVWYYSPFRPDEKTASFKVNLKMNTWYDFGQGAGGSILDLWLDIKNLDRKNGQNIKQALAELAPFANESNIETSFQQTTRKREIEEKPSERFTLIKQPSRIWMDSLKEELERRAISPTTAMKHLKQAYFKDNQTGKSFNGFAFRNDKEGYEISVPNPQKGTSFKTAIGAKAPSTVTSKVHTSIMLFEGFWDYLSYLEMSGNTNPDYQIIVLNSLSFAQEVARDLAKRNDQITNVILFLDNDTAGEKAVHQIAEIIEPTGITTGTMNHLYEGFKDLNDYWKNGRQKFPSKSNTNERKVFNDSAWNTIKPIKHIA